MEFTNFIIGMIALVVGIVAMVMAAPPFFQMIYGRPKIRIRFDSTVERGVNLLLCNIYNLPVTNFFLKMLGVTRSPTDVFASFDVREHGTNKIIANSFRASLFDGKANVSGLTLVVKPPLPIVFSIMEHGDEGAFAHDCAPSQHKSWPLPPGEYFADVKIASGEYTVQAVAQSFTVDADKFASHWTARKIVGKW